MPRGDRIFDPGRRLRRPDALGSLFCRNTGLVLALPRSQPLNSEFFNGWNARVSAPSTWSRPLPLIRRELWQALGGFDPAFAITAREAGPLRLRPGARRRRRG